MAVVFLEDKKSAKPLNSVQLQIARESLEKEGRLQPVVANLPPVTRGLKLREMAARLRANQEASVVNIVSTAATQPIGRSHHYVTSKAGLLGLTRSLALEFAPTIRVNAVSPGFVATENHRGGCSDRIDQTPLKRLIESEEIAEAVLFLVRQRGITGTNLIVDGGWSLNHE